MARGEAVRIGSNITARFATTGPAPFEGVFHQSTDDDVEQQGIDQIKGDFVNWRI